jgi:hypothetical protein
MMLRNSGKPELRCNPSIFAKLSREEDGCAGLRTVHTAAAYVGDSLLQPPQPPVREHAQADRRHDPDADGAKSGMSCQVGETLRDSPVFSG